MSWLDAPYCIRYEDNPSDRVLMVWAFACGLLGGGAKVNAFTRSIKYLYDYKGTLYVAWSEAEPDASYRHDRDHIFRRVLREAWEDMGNEPAECVQFVALGSDDWLTVWESRRFSEPPVRFLGAGS